MPGFRKDFARHLQAGTVLVLLAVAGVCLAGEDRYGVRDIHHSAWTSENGVSAVFEQQQNSDGYLWLNIANGVVRFDGVRFQSPSCESLSFKTTWMSLPYEIVLARNHRNLQSP
jgi:ligand-binding sensor domain-containing protein